MFMGEGSKVTMRRAFAKAGRTLDEAEASAVTREFVRYYEADPVSHTIAFDGVAEVVARFDRMGLKQGVCTNKFENPSRIILQHLKLMPPITDVAGADTFTVRKPDPGHILQLIDKMGGHRDRAVMIGDSIHDVAAAHARRAAGRAGELGLYRQARQRARRRGRDRSLRRPARRAGADCRPLTIRPGRPYTRPFRALSSAGEHTLHTGGVVGSIPTAPTIAFGHWCTGGRGYGPPIVRCRKSRTRTIEFLVASSLNSARCPLIVMPRVGARDRSS